MRPLATAIAYAAAATIVYLLTGYIWVVAIGGLLTLSALTRAAFTALERRRSA